MRMNWRGVARTDAILLKYLITLCYSEHMRRWAWSVVLAAALVGAAHAQLQRMLPANGKLGEVVGRQPFPLVQINSKILRLAPGGLILDQHNRSIVHGALPPEAQVLFVEDPNGNVTRIYLLRPDELERIQRAR